MGQTSIWLAVVATAGIVVGIGLLVRGFSGYLSAGRITGTSPSRIASIAVGEVLVTGSVEPAEVLLVSPLQSTECVFYRSRVTATDDNGEGRDVFRDDRAVGFRVRDPSGSVRVFPRGARFDVPDRYDERSGSLSDAVGLRPRTGPVYAPGPEDRESRIAELLTVHHPSDSTPFGAGGSPLLGSGGFPFSSGSRRHYREARIEPGDVVTVIGKVLPFSELSDPTEANLLDGAGVGADDPEIAGDLAEAREAGLLEATPEAAWGNAAIPGFGIGQPVRQPELDPRAHPLPLATPQAAARAEATFEIRPETLILASTLDGPLGIALGAPGAVAARGQGEFLVGLLGAVLAIGAAIGLALILNGSIR